ncbi:unnamed protein product, partial [marine sediment metagenome]
MELAVNPHLSLGKKVILSVEQKLVPLEGKCLECLSLVFPESLEAVIEKEVAQERAAILLRNGYFSLERGEIFGRLILE